MSRHKKDHGGKSGNSNKKGDFLNNYSEEEQKGRKIPVSYHIHLFRYMWYNTINLILYYEKSKLPPTYLTEGAVYFLILINCGGFEKLSPFLFE